MHIDADNKELSVVRQCELLSISRSSLYYEPVKESQENLTLMRLMDEQYMKTPFYGVERLLVLFVVIGYKLNRKRLRRLMSLMGWQTLYPAPHAPPALIGLHTSTPICSEGFVLKEKIRYGQ